MRRVYVYDWPEEPNHARLVLAYLTLQHTEVIPGRLCVHDIETMNGPEAKRLALREHKALCPKPEAAR